MYTNIRNDISESPRFQADGRFALQTDKHIHFLPNTRASARSRAVLTPTHTCYLRLASIVFVSQPSRFTLKAILYHPDSRLIASCSISSHDTYRRGDNPYTIAKGDEKQTPAASSLSRPLNFLQRFFVEFRHFKFFNCRCSIFVNSIRVKMFILRHTDHQNQ